MPCSVKLLLIIAFTTLLLLLVTTFILSKVGRPAKAITSIREAGTPRQYVFLFLHLEEKWLIMPQVKQDADAALHLPGRHEFGL